MRNIFKKMMVGALLFGAIAFLVTPYSSRAAISLVQTASGNGGNYVNSYSVSYASSVTAGDLLVATLTTGSADTIASFADNNTNTWILAAATTTPSNRTTRIYYVTNSHGGSTTVTPTFGAGQFNDSALIIREYGGITTTSPLDKTAVGTDAGFQQTHSTAASAATTQASELVIVGMGVSSSTPAYAAGSGYGNLAQQRGFDNFTSSAMEDKTVSSTGAQTGVFTTTEFANGQTVLATFKSAGTTLPAPTVKAQISAGTVRVTAGILRIQ